MKKIMFLCLVSFNVVSSESLDNLMCSNLIDRYNEVYTMVVEHRRLSDTNGAAAKSMSSHELVEKRVKLSKAYSIIADGFEHSLSGYRIAMDGYGCEVEFTE